MVQNILAPLLALICAVEMCVTDALTLVKEALREGSGAGDGAYGERGELVDGRGERGKRSRVLD